MTCRTAFIDVLLAEVFGVYFSGKLSGYLCTARGIISLSPYHLLTGLTDVTLGTSGFCLGTRTGAGGNVTPAKSFILAAAHDSMNNRSGLENINLH